MTISFHNPEALKEFISYLRKLNKNHSEYMIKSDISKLMICFMHLIIHPDHINKAIKELDGPE